MAVFKVLLMATLPFIAAPFNSSGSQMINADAMLFGVPPLANPSANYSGKSHGKSTIYKNQPMRHFLPRPSDETDEETVLFPDYDAVVVENRKYLEV